MTTSAVSRPHDHPLPLLDGGVLRLHSHALRGDPVYVKYRASSDVRLFELVAQATVMPDLHARVV